MRHGAIFIFLGAVLVATTLGRAGLGWSTFALAWTAVTFVAVGVAYLLKAHRALGKRADGTIGVVGALWLPFLLPLRVLHELERLLRGQPANHEVAPGLFVGRRPRPYELPEGVVLVVDLCAELPASAAIRSSSTLRYLSVPTLDASVPEAARLRSAVDAVLSSPGPVLVHCASGHGRSAAIAAAVLIARGTCGSVEAAEQHLRQARPNVRLSRLQRQAVRDLQQPPALRSG